MDRRSALRLAAGFPLTGLIAGCAGGGTSVSHAASAVIPTQAAIARANYAKVVLSLQIPKSGLGLGKRPQYVGAGVNYFTLAVDGGAAGSNIPCATTTCSATLNLLPGLHTFGVNTYDNRGYLLGTTGAAPAGGTIVLNQQNNIAITPSGVVRKVVPLVSCTQGSASYATNVPLQFLDADNNPITGTFASPISVSGYGGTVVSNAILPIANSTQAARVAMVYPGTGTSFMSISAAPTLSGNGLPATISALGYTQSTSQLAYVTNRGDGLVSVVNVGSRTGCGNITLTGANPPNPEGIAITPDGKRLFVADNANNTLDVIDLTTYAIQNVPVGASPHGVAYVNTPVDKAFVANGGSNNISLIASASTCAIGSCGSASVGLTTLAAPYGITAAPYSCCGNFNVYVTNSSGNSFTNFSGGYLDALPTSFTTTSLASPAPNFQPYSIALDATGNNLFLLGENASGSALVAQHLSGNGYLYGLGAVLTQPRSPRGVALDASASHVYVAFGSTLAALSLSSGIGNINTNCIYPPPQTGSAFSGVNVGTANVFALDAGANTATAYATPLSSPAPVSFSGTTAPNAPNSIALGPLGAGANGEGAVRKPLFNGGC